MKQNILILTNRPLHNGPRIIREIEALKTDFEITVIGRTPPVDKDVKFIFQADFIPSLPERAIHKFYRVLNGGKYISWPFPTLLKLVRKYIKKACPNIIIAHDPEFLPYLKILKQTYDFKIVYNAHEYHPLQFDSDVKWLKTIGYFYDKIYRNYLCYVDLMINVCNGIKDKCLQEYGKDSIVIPNACTYYPNIQPIFNKELPIKVIHHGGAIKQRRIEIMIDTIEQLNGKFTLDLILLKTDPIYYSFLEKKIANCKYVKTIEPVAFNQIVPLLNKYDIGLFNLPPDTFNYKYALPNKLFEFIQARLCIVISNSIEMKKIVKENDLGWVSEGFGIQELTNILNQIDLDTINSFKKSAAGSAEKLSAEHYYNIYLNSIDCLVASK